MTLQYLEERKNEIVNDYNNGMNMYKLSVKYKVNSGLMYYFFANNDIPITRTHYIKYNKIDDFKDEIIKMTMDGLSSRKIANTLNINKSTMLRYLKKIGYSTSHLSFARQDPLKNHTDEIINMYKSGIMTKDICKKFNASNASIWTLLDKNGIKCDKNIKYTVNESYFDNIDNKDKAYWLGLMYADGNVTNKGVVRISLQEEDGYILGKFSECLEYTGNLKRIIKEGNRKPQLSLTVSRAKLARALSSKGCVPAKSLILTFPDKDIISDELLPHFIRGYMDGDGFIHKKKKVINMVGTEMFINGMLKRLPFNLNYKIYIRHPERNTTTRQFFISQAEEVIKFLNYIYQDANIYLKRKYNRYLNILGV